MAHLSSQEIEDLIRSGHQYDLPTPSTDMKSLKGREPSKAYASAMRALQEKIRHLEEENAILRERLALSETDRSKWQEQSMGELRDSRHKESSLLSKIQFLEEDNHELMNLKLSLENQIAVQNSQIEYIEMTRKRNEQQFAIDSENLSLEVAALNKSLQRQSENERFLKQQVEKLEIERRRAEEEINNSRKQGKSTSYENGIAKQYTELQAQVMTLKKKNSSLVKLNKTQASQIEQLEAQQRTRSLSGKIRNRQKLAKSASRKSIADCSPAPRNRHIGAHLNQNSEVKIQNNIAHIEQELDNLNRKYRRLVKRSNDEAYDLANINRDLNLLSNEINSKSQMILNLKKSHQEVLRQKIYSPTKHT